MAAELNLDGWYVIRGNIDGDNVRMARGLSKAVQSNGELAILDNIERRITARSTLYLWFEYLGSGLPGLMFATAPYDSWMDNEANPIVPQSGTRAFTLEDLCRMASAMAGG